MQFMNRRANRKNYTDILMFLHYLLPVSPPQMSYFLHNWNSKPKKQKSLMNAL